MFARKVAACIAIVCELPLLSGCLGSDVAPPAPTRLQFQPSFAIDGGNIGRTYVYKGEGTVGLNAPLWRYKSDKSGYVTAVVAGNKELYSVNTDSESVSVSLYALSTETGQVQWHSGDGGVPTLAEGRLYFGGKFGLHAVDADTGKEQWTFGLDARLHASITTSPLVSNDTVYFGSNRGSLYAVEAGSGNKKWELKVGNSFIDDPATDGATLYFGGDVEALITGPDAHGQNVLYAVDAQTGKQKWSFQPPLGEQAQKLVYDVMVDSGRVYCIGVLSDLSQTRSVYALDSANGKQLWNFDLQDGKYGSTYIAAEGGLVYAATTKYDVDDYNPYNRDAASQGTLYALDAETGRVKWTFSTRSSLVAPILSDSMVYLGSTDQNKGTLHILDAKTGRELKTFSLQNALLQSPVIAGGVLYALESNFDPVHSNNANNTQEYYLDAIP